MTNRPQQIARLRCLSFLIDEALRLADEGELAEVISQLLKANDRVFYDLEKLNLSFGRPSQVRVLVADGLDEM